MDIQLDQGQLAEVRITLSNLRNGASLAISRATNDTLSNIRTNSVSLIRDEVTLTATVIRQHFRVRNSTVANLSGQVTCTGRPVPLINYSARAVRAGVSIQVLRSSPRSTVNHAFISTMDSGHRGVFWRMWRADRRPHRRGFPYGVLPRKYRLPINELYGPRIPDVLDNPDIIYSVLARANIRLQERLDHHTNYLLSRAA